MHGESMSDLCARPSNLTSSPLDIILCILDFLDIPEKASLSLCCRSFYYTFGQAACTPLHHKHSRGRGALLNLLARDSPDLFSCEPCSILHASTSVGPLLFDKWLHDSAGDCPRNIFKGLNFAPAESSYRFNRHHVRLAMSRYRHGSAHGIALNQLSAKEICVNTKAFDATGLIKCFSVEPKVIADELCLRVQRIAFVPDIDLLSRALLSDRLATCKHISTLAGNVKDLIRCKLDHSDRLSQCPTCSPLLKCKFCDVEFQITTQKLTHGGVFIVTMVLNFGSGQDEWDPKWTRHVQRSALLGMKPPTPFVKVTKSNRIWNAFENVLMPLSQLTSANISLVRSESYKDYFEHPPWIFCGSTWRNWIYQPSDRASDIKPARTSKTPG